MLRTLEDVSSRWDQTELGVHEPRKNCHLHLDVDRLSRIWVWVGYSTGVAEPGRLELLSWTAVGGHRPQAGPSRRCSWQMVVDSVRNVVELHLAGEDQCPP